MGRFSDHAVIWILMSVQNMAGVNEACKGARVREQRVGCILVHCKLSARL